MPFEHCVAFAVGNSVEPVSASQGRHGPAGSDAAQLGDRGLQADPVGVVAGTELRTPWALRG